MHPRTKSGAGHGARVRLQMEPGGEGAGGSRAQVSKVRVVRRRLLSASAAVAGDCRGHCALCGIERHPDARVEIGLAHHELVARLAPDFDVVDLVVEDEVTL